MTVAHKFSPLFDRIVVRRDGTERVTRGGIIIPETYERDKPQVGEVISVGPGKADENGVVQPMVVKPGDRILFGKWSGAEIKIDDEQLVIMQQADVLGVLHDV